MNCKIVCHQNNQPVIRGALARGLYENMMREEQLRCFDHSKWYQVDLSRIDPSIAVKFMKMSYDNETDQFIQNCYRKSEWLFTHLFNAVARAFLSLFLTSTSVNGLLKRGSMFVFSGSQFSLLYDEIASIKSDSNSILLDLGSGDGCVTSIMAQHFHQTYCTEVSPVMKKILLKNGYKLLDADKWAENDLSFDLISCLNLLDRCEKPMTTMKLMRRKVKPNGRVLIAIVLPLNQFVEASTDHIPKEILPLTGADLEEQVESFIKEVVQPNGFDLVSWTKLPYLSEGDLELSYYWLIDILFLLRPNSSITSPD